MTDLNWCAAIQERLLPGPWECLDRQQRTEVELRFPHLIHGRGTPGSCAQPAPTWLGRG